MTSKVSLALFFVICNALYIIICIARFIYTGSQILINFDKAAPVQLSQNSLWYIIPQILFVLVFVGVGWVLAVFNEKFWIKLALILFVVRKIILIIILHSIGARELMTYQLAVEIINITIAITLVYLVIALLFVRSSEIKVYFRWLAILMVLATMLPKLGEILYDDLSIHGFVFNADALADTCLFIPLLLFVRLYLSFFKEKSIS
jgi:hypothetical protein